MNGERIGLYTRVKRTTGSPELTQRRQRWAAIFEPTLTGGVKLGTNVVVAMSNKLKRATCSR